MNKCKDCKYFGDEVEYYGKDTSEPIKTGHHQCNKIYFFFEKTEGV